MLMNGVTWMISVVLPNDVYSLNWVMNDEKSVVGVVVVVVV